MPEGTVIRLPPSASPFVDEDQNLLLPWMEENHRRFGPIFRSQAYGAAVYVVSDPIHAEYVLRRNWQNYRKGRAIKRIRLLLGQGLMVSEGDLWKRQRRMIHPAFHEKAIRSLVSLFTEVSQALLQRWCVAARQAVVVNATRDISLAILEIILKAIFGHNYSDVADQFGILSEESERTLQFAHAFRTLASLVKDIVAQRNATTHESSDILGLLMQARDRDSNEGISINQIVDEVLTLVVAGHETTASTLNWVWYLLWQNPEVAEKLRAEVSGTNDVRQLPYTARVIDETMRLYPAGWLMTRKAIADDRLEDYVVPAGTEIFVSPYIIQRRPDLWPDPDRFDPDRIAPAHSLAMLPFSAGPRNCIGEHFARWEMLVHMHTIASKLKLCYLGGEPELDFGINLRSRQDFMMRPILIA